MRTAVLRVAPRRSPIQVPLCLTSVIQREPVLTGAIAEALILAGVVFYESNI